MNQPTREEHEQLKDRVRKLEEQQTEPINLTIERRYPDKELLQEISRKQDEHARLLLAHSKGISTLQENVGSTQTEIKEIRAEILAIRESQADQRDTLNEHTGLLKQILAKLEEK